MLEAIQQHAYALEYASDALVLAAVKQDGYALQFVWVDSFLREFSNWC